MVVLLQGRDKLDRKKQRSKLDWNSFSPPMVKFFIVVFLCYNGFNTKPKSQQSNNSALTHFWN